MLKRIGILALLFCLVTAPGCGWIKSGWRWTTNWIGSWFSSSPKKTAPKPLPRAGTAKDGFQLLAKRKYVAAAAAFTRRLAAGVSDPRQRVDLLLGRAQAMYWLKEDYRCLADLNEAIGLDPKKAELYDWRLHVWARQGRIDRAAEDADRLVALAPKSPVARFNRALIRVKRRRFKDALDDLAQAIKLSPEMAAAYHLRGVVFLQQKRNARAVRDLSRATRLRPKNPEYWLDYGIGEYQRGRLGAAVEHSSRAISLDPNLARAYYNRGMMYFRLGKTLRAKQDLSRFMAMTGIIVMPKPPKQGPIRLTPGGGIMAPGAFRLPDSRFRPGR
jgi:tetratricopeptide (TPR) repeat protein